MCVLEPEFYQNQIDHFFQKYFHFKYFRQKMALVISDYRINEWSNVIEIEKINVRCFVVGKSLNTFFSSSFGSRKLKIL